MSRRVNNEARERILKTAYELFSMEGYEAVSMERVAAAAGMKKATVFYYYSSKEALGRAVLQAAAKRHAAGMRAMFTDSRQEPEIVVSSLFDYGMSGGTRNCSRGCFIGKMGHELTERNIEMRRSVAVCMRDWRREVARYFDGWRKKGYFRPGFNAIEAADGILSLYEGGVLLARIMRASEPAEHARRVAVRVIVSWRG